MINGIILTKADKCFGIEYQHVEQELTTEALIDDLFLCLAGVKQRIKNDKNYKTISMRKYYVQAKILMRWIPIAIPVPEFVINISDLTSSIRKEIEFISDTLETLKYVTTQAVGRIFENLNFQYYHLSVAKNLRVRFEP